MKGLWFEPVLSGAISSAWQVLHRAAPAALSSLGSRELCGAWQAVQSPMATENTHSPVSDCFQCHQPHGARQMKLLQKPVAELCEECHSYDDNFTKAHAGIPARDTMCVNCHNPHVSKDPKMFGAEVHPPFAEGDCSLCHVVSKK